MAKRNSVAPVVETVVSPLAGMTREELKVRYDANVAERKRLSEENQQIGILWKGAVSSEKKSSAEAKIAALQAKLAALTAEAPAVAEPAAVTG